MAQVTGLWLHSGGGGHLGCILGFWLSRCRRLGTEPANGRTLSLSLPPLSLEGEGHTPSQGSQRPNRLTAGVSLCISCSPASSRHFLPFGDRDRAGEGRPDPPASVPPHLPSSTTPGLPRCPWRFCSPENDPAGNSPPGTQAGRSETLPAASRKVGCGFSHLLPATFPGGRTLRQGHSPPTLSPTLFPPPPPPPPRAEVPSRAARRGARGAPPGAHVARDGSLPLADPEGPGTRLGEVPEAWGDRVSPRSLSGGHLWEGGVGACQPGMDAPDFCPRRAGQAGVRVPRHGARALAGWPARDLIPPEPHPFGTPPSSPAPRSPTATALRPGPGTATLFKRWGEKEFCATRASGKSARVLKGLRVSYDSGRRGPLERGRCVRGALGSRDADSVSLAGENSLSCLLRGPRGDLNRRTALWSQQLGFCSRTGNNWGHRVLHTSCEGHFFF